MVLRLDPRHPLVWRTPTSLQFGVTGPAVVLSDLDVGSEKMIAALSGGISRSGLDMMARSAGLDPTAVDALLTRLRPVMVREKPPTPAPVVVAGTGLLADRVAALLAAEGVPTLLAHTVAAAEATQASFAIVIGRYVLDPELHGLWLRRDVEHLPVILGDSSVAIGPLVEPGRTACLFCLQRHATDADPAWPAIASQLWGRPSPVETEMVASEAAAIVARLVLSRGDASTQLVIEASTGAQSRRSFAVHPLCGCAGLASAEGQRENVTAFDPAAPTTTGTAAFARA